MIAIAPKSDSSKVIARLPGIVGIPAAFFHAVGFNLLPRRGAVATPLIGQLLNF